MYFKTLELKKWQQFEYVSIDLDCNLTILTGQNGSGKTTLLNILSMHHDWEFQPLSTPRMDNQGLWKYIVNIFGRKDKGDQIEIGKIGYSNSVTAKLTVPSESGPQYSIQIHDKQNTPCFFIPSHSSIYNYQTITNIPTEKKNKQQAFNEVSNSIKAKYRGGRGQPYSFLMKSTLIGWVINGYGVLRKDKYVMPKDEEQIQYFEGFQEILKQILPVSLGFQELEIRNMEIVFVCNDGEDEFMMETASGGICSLIDLAWQIFMYSTDKKSEFTVLIDEIENHLHPTMQRRVLPDFIKAFPNVKFIVATHNPLIVNSHRESQVYLLQYNERNKIESQRLDFQKNPMTANEILNDVLGVPTSLPIWVEEKLRHIIEKNQNSLTNKEGFRNLRNDLKEIGFDSLFPETVVNILENDN